MGHLASYVVVENGRYTLWHSYWTAHTLTRDLFWGPDWALAFIHRQEPSDERLDDVWDEGGAVVDLDKKVLLLFGGEDIGFDPSLRRVYLELLRIVWSGWTVRWAFEGLVDIAEYVGAERARALIGGDGIRGAPPELADKWKLSVASARWEDGRIGVYPMNCLADYLILYGAGLVDVLRRIAETSGSAPTQQEPLVLDWNCLGGLHVNMSDRRVDFWIANPLPDGRERTRRRWPGWTVEWHRDDSEIHCALADRKLAFERRSEKTLLDAVIQTLEYQSDESAINTFLEIVGTLTRQGKKVEINPDALVSAPQAVPADVRQRILRDARRSFLERR